MTAAQWWQEDPVELARIRRLESESRAGRRTGTVSGRRRKEAWQRSVREQGTEAMRQIGAMTRELKDLERRAPAIEGVTVRPGRRLAFLREWREDRARRLARRASDALMPARANPGRGRGGVAGQIYPQLVAVIARKRARPIAPADCPECGAPNGRDLYMHRFIERGRRLPAVPVVALSDGSVLLRRVSAPLWVS